MCRKRWRRKRKSWKLYNNCRYISNSVYFPIFHNQIVVRYKDAFLLSQWLERGVFEALEKKFLKSLTFAIYTKHPRTKKDFLLETYQFVVDYPEGKNPTLNGISMTRENLKKQAVTFIRCLVEFSSTLDELPEERWLTMKILVRQKTSPRAYSIWSKFIS